VLLGEHLREVHLPSIRRVATELNVEAASAETLFDKNRRHRRTADELFDRLGGRFLEVRPRTLIAELLDAESPSEKPPDKGRSLLGMEPPFLFTKHVLVLQQFGDSLPTGSRAAYGLSKNVVLVLFRAPEQGAIEFPSRGAGTIDWLCGPRNQDVRELRDGNAVTGNREDFLVLG